MHHSTEAVILINLVEINSWNYSICAKAKTEKEWIVICFSSNNSFEWKWKEIVLFCNDLIFSCDIKYWCKCLNLVSLPGRVMTWECVMEWIKAARLSEIIAEPELCLGDRVSHLASVGNDEDTHCALSNEYSRLPKWLEWWHPVWQQWLTPSTSVAYSVKWWGWCQTQIYNVFLKARGNQINVDWEKMDHRLGGISVNNWLCVKYEDWNKPL